MSSDRNLLFGILAVQMNFISRDALIQAMHAWVLNKEASLGDILQQQNHLAVERAQLLDALVQEHLKTHDNDPHKSLAALSSIESLKEALQQVPDQQLQQTLQGVTVSSAAFRQGVQQSIDTTRSFVTADSSSRFRILRPHAKGGLGEVFVAEDTELHREVALKEIQDRHSHNEESRGRFILEAEVTGGLEHPNIVPVYGLGTYADGRPYYAMRFIRGDSLKEAIERFYKTTFPNASERNLAFRNLLKRFVDVCNAIAYAHSRGILHRDLKPGNIMLGKYGETLVVDWGLAKALGKRSHDGEGASVERTLNPSGSSYAETMAGSAIGTPAFMSPEQAAGRLDQLGPASDVYSLGATLYVLLTGEHPFKDNPLDILKKVEAGDFPAPRQARTDTPLSLNAVVLKAMAKQQDERYPTATALAGEIEHYLADESVEAHREPLVERTKRWARKHPGMVAGLTATLLVGVLGLVVGSVMLRGKNEELSNANESLVLQKNRAIAAETLAKTNEEKAKDRAEQARKQRDRVNFNMRFWIDLSIVGRSIRTKPLVTDFLFDVVIKPLDHASVPSKSQNEKRIGGHRSLFQRLQDLSLQLPAAVKGMRRPENYSLLSIRQAEAERIPSSEITIGQDDPLFRDLSDNGGLLSRPSRSLHSP